MSLWNDSVLYDRSERIPSIVTSVAALIDRGGMGAVTMRSVAADVRMAHSGIAYDLRNRERMLEVAAHQYGYRIRRVREFDDGAVALLPAVGESLLPTRVWLAFVELALSHAGVAEAVAEVAAEEKDWLVSTCPTLGAPGSVETAHALVTGLRHAICRTIDPLSVETARDLFGAHLAAFPEPARSQTVVSAGRVIR